MSAIVFDLELPLLSTDQAPAFTNAESCRKWLSEIPFTNARAAQTQLLRQINLLNRFTLPPEERLAVLELLRAPAYFVHDECALRFTGRPLPLAPPEQAALETCQVLWQALETGYLHCLQAFSARTGAEARQNAALAATRVLTTLLAMYFDDCHAGMIPVPPFWQRLHRVYRIAEQAQAPLIPVEDTLRHQSATTAMAAYIEVLLMAAASPLELRPRQFNQVTNWAQRWSNKVPVLSAPPLDLRTPPLCVNLAGEQMAVFRQPLKGSDSLRWMDMAELRKTIKQRLNALAQGESPESLHLGKDCIQPDCESLLKQVYQDWCRGGRNTNIQVGINGTCQLVNGIDAIHYFLSGRVFREPKAGGNLNQRQHDQIATLGGIAEHSPEDEALAQSYGIEDWKEINEDVTDILLQRPLNQPGDRMARGQLVAVRTSSNDSLQVGKVHWVALNANRDALIASVHTMPGPPIATILHTPGFGGIKSQYRRGFSLPAIEGLGEPASVLTPSGWFQTNHIIQVQSDESTIRIRLMRMIERGINFERCTYEAVTD